MLAKGTWEDIAAGSELDFHSAGLAGPHRTLADNFPADGVGECPVLACENVHLRTDTALYTQTTTLHSRPLVARPLKSFSLLRTTRSRCRSAPTRALSSATPLQALTAMVQLARVFMTLRVSALTVVSVSSRP